MTKCIVGCQWLTPVILATQEADILRIMVPGHPNKISSLQNRSCGGRGVLVGGERLNGGDKRVNMVNVLM
jgi:hypothetical protein